MTATTSIANTTFIAVRPDGYQSEIAVKIGTPYQCGEAPGEWACPVALSGLYDRLSDPHGGDAFQALCLAIRLALSLLSGFVADGGRLLFKTGEEVPLEAYGLGPGSGK